MTSLTSVSALAADWATNVGGGARLPTGGAPGANGGILGGGLIVSCNFARMTHAKFGGGMPVGNVGGGIGTSVANRIRVGLCLISACHCATPCDPLWRRHTHGKGTRERRKRIGHRWVVPSCHQGLVLSQRGDQVGLWNDSVRMSYSSSSGCSCHRGRPVFRLFTCFPLGQCVGGYSFHTEDFDIVAISSG